MSRDGQGSGPEPTVPAAAAPAPTGTRVVLVDARPERRAVLRSVFEHSDVPTTVVGEADNAADGINEVHAHAADLVVIDFPAPAQDGLATIAALRSRFPALVIVVCSFDSTDDTRQKALAKGADAYLLKPVSAREIVAAMGTVPPRARAMQSTAASG